MNYWHKINIWQDIEPSKWMDWRWQLKNAVRTPQELKRILNTSALHIDDSQVLNSAIDTFEMKLTPYIAARIFHSLKKGDITAAKVFMNIFVPSGAEIECIDNGIDGIGEEAVEVKPAPLITNFYKSRVLFFVTNMCSAYCRYCFRRRKVGKHLNKEDADALNLQLINQSIQYIKDNHEIKEVIISGGDPFILNDKKLLSILRQLKQIAHIEALRIDTKILTSLPQRITQEIVGELKKLKPLYVVGNFLHSAELTSEVLNTTSLLIDAGIPIISHTALLKGINDDATVIAELMWKLYVNRIIPYYLIQFIPTKWTGHFRVPIQKGLEIMKSLHGRLSGIANPAYVVYLPDGAGKVPLLPNYLLERTTEGYYFKNFEGKKVLYKEQIEL